MTKDNWTEDQITMVLYEYCRNPLGQFSVTNQCEKGNIFYLLHIEKNENCFNLVITHNSNTYEKL